MMRVIVIVTVMVTVMAIVIVTVIVTVVVTVIVIVIVIVVVTVMVIVMVIVTDSNTRNSSISGEGSCGGEGLGAKAEPATSPQRRHPRSKTTTMTRHTPPREAPAVPPEGKGGALEEECWGRSSSAGHRRREIWTRRSRKRGCLSGRIEAPGKVFRIMYCKA